jgi:hypothetical protein
MPDDLKQVLMDGISIYVVIDGEPCYGSLYHKSPGHYRLVVLRSDDELWQDFPESEVRITDEVDELGNRRIDLLVSRPGASMNKYLLSIKHPESYEVVTQDLGRTEKSLEYLSEEFVRVFSIEPGNDSCGTFYRVLSERPDGSLYTVLENGKVVEFQLAEELPEGID